MTPARTESTPPSRRLIVNADDFGRSEAINEAVRQAHQGGILTSASLMVAGDACAAAVAIARANPTLGVGLHLTLTCGQSVLPHDRIPGLTHPHRGFLRGPVRAGISYFFRPSLREQLRCEIAAQFDRFHETGLPLDHLNGHLNLQLHPTILGLLCEHAVPWGVRSLRLTRDPLRLNARLASGHWPYRLSHAVVFRLLAAYARPRLRRLKIRHTERVFGLLQNGRVNPDYVTRLIPVLPLGDSELYSHPSLTEFEPELAALTDPKVRRLIQHHQIQLIRYQDL